MRWFGYRSFLASVVVGGAVVGGLLAGGGTPAVAADPVSPEDATFFQTKIKPVLMENCSKCHAKGKHKGGFKIDSREDMLKGGEDGVQVVPGEPGKSPMMAAIKWDVKDDEKKMPPPEKGKKLSEQQIADITKWIEKGLPWPEGK